MTKLEWTERQKDKPKTVEVRQHLFAGHKLGRGSPGDAI